STKGKTPSLLLNFCARWTIIYINSDNIKWLCIYIYICIYVYVSLIFLKFYFIKTFFLNLNFTS
ncbi:MAG: hypothetical protein N7Q72_05200, partial [Spiroplasma sp. Tabriz.8]|nr:hypothetical protein [Spiroplasma sp. Tabriz.8]